MILRFSQQVISIVPDVLLSSEVRQIVSTWTLAPVRELVLHHAAQLDRLFTTVSGLICILKELQWYFPQCGSTMVHLNSLNSLDNSNVDVDDELVPQGWVDVLYHLDQLDSSGEDVLFRVMTIVNDRALDQIRRNCIDLEQVRTALSVPLSHLLWIRTNWCRAHHLYCAVLHRSSLVDYQITDLNRCMEYFSTVPFGRFFLTVVQICFSDFERRLVSVPTSQLFNEAVRNAIETVVPTTLSLEEARDMVEKGIPFQISEPAPINIPVHQLLSNRTIIFTACGLCFELFQTTSPDHVSECILVLRWIWPGCSESERRTDLKRMCMTACKDVAVGTAAANLVHIQPHVRRGAPSEPTMDAIPCCIRIQVGMTGWVYRQKQSRSHEVEPITFPLVDQFIIPYDQIQWQVPRSIRGIEHLQITVQVTLQVPQIMYAVGEHLETILEHPQEHAWVHNTNYQA